MKNSPITAVLLGLLAISALASLVLCWSLTSKARELRGIQAAVNQINERNAGINALVADVVEYSKTHPAIDPILESVGAKPAAKTLTLPPATPSTRNTAK